MTTKAAIADMHMEREMKNEIVHFNMRVAAQEWKLGTGGQRLSACVDLLLLTMKASPSIDVLGAS